ncbi:MAG: hypothetical protein HY829_15515 [Actinobacteria bacterium]|nr:hypothetical protein [Actinomycetota bacterium]
MEVPEGVFGENELRLGMTNEELLGAVGRSGYPFQAVVTELIEEQLQSSGNLAVYEEWSYRDSDTDTIRQLDALVILNGKPREHGSQFVRTRLVLLVECKKSDNPYVFFTRDKVQYWNILEGFPSEWVTIHDYPRDFDYRMHVSDFFGLYDLPINCIPHAVSIARAEWQQKKIVLSGEEFFRSLYHPLLKARDYFCEISRNNEDPLIRTITMVLPIAVLDAPMRVVVGGGERVQLEEAVGIRVTRLEPRDSFDRMTDYRSYFDAVHVGALEDYLRLAQDALSTITARVLRHEPTIYCQAARVEEPSDDSTAPLCESAVPGMDPEEYLSMKRAEYRRVHSLEGTHITVSRTRF